MYTIEEFQSPRTASHYDVPAAAVREFGAETIKRGIAETEASNKAQRAGGLRKILVAAWVWFSPGEFSRPSTKVAVR